MNYKELIKRILEKRGFETEPEMDAFLHPSLDMFHNPFLLSGMKEAVERIRFAIKNNQKIVIYGDYDCDGVSAVSILYLYFKSIGVNSIGFIPSRHTDGYGLSSQTVKFIKNEYNPDLVITVDTGISAYAEIEELKALNIDTIVTDHHEPPEIIPNTIVVDPKLKNDYPFSGLSGAGVAFKLVQALSDLNTALEYVDIASISTVGDIVPLLDENRIIVKLGLESINGKTPRPSIAFLKSKLKLTSLSSTDIAFKIVPRLNACGRISSAEKCFKFLVEENANELEKLYNEIESDNNLRLDMSAEIMSRVDENLKTIDLNHSPAVFIRDDEINLGLLGIVASRLVSSLNRPVFVFTKDEAGNLKASVRSIEGINIFSVLDKFRDLMIDVGGHSLAGGLTISPENYDKLKKLVNLELMELDQSVFKISSGLEYDAEIGEKDINMSLASAVVELEPFGYMNPRPIFKLNTKIDKYTQMKSIKHFKIPVGKSTEIVSFFGEKLSPYFLTHAEKELFVTLEVDNFFSRPRAKAMLKDINVFNYKFKDELELRKAKEIYTISTDSVKKKDFREIYTREQIDVKPFNTLIVVDKYSQAMEFKNKYKLKVRLEPLESGESVIVYNPHRLMDANCIKMYKTIYLIGGENYARYLSSLGDAYVYFIRESAGVSLDITRDKFKEIYVHVSRCLPATGNNVFEIIEKISDKTNLSPKEIAGIIKCSEELGFYEVKAADDGTVEIKVNKTPQKTSLESSIVFNALK